METNKKVQVIILRTKDKNSRLIKSDAYSGVRNILIYQNNKSFKNDRKHHLRERFHLYFTSDDEIKEGDWYVIKQLSKNYQVATQPCKKEEIELQSKFDCKKIIATTDKSLTIGEENSWKNRKDILYPNTLPQPSQAFIRKYCESGGIDEVLVEYEKNEQVRSLAKFELNSNYGNPSIKKTKEQIDNLYKLSKSYKIKVDQYNTITIHPIKDSWSREEVIELCRKAIDYAKGVTSTTYLDDRFDNWIEKNL